MVNLKKMLVSALIITSTMSVAGCGLIDKSPEARLATVIATANGEDITIADLNELLQYDIDWLTEEYGENYEDVMDAEMKATWDAAKEHALNQIIEEKILLTKAESMGVSFTEEEMQSKIQEEYDSYLEYYGGQEALDEQMAAFGYTNDSFRELIKTQIISQAVVNAIVQDVSVTEEEIRAHYNDNLADYTIGAGATMKHILYRTEEEAIAAKTDIDTNRNFDALFDSFKGNEYVDGVPIAEDLGFVEYNSEYFDADFLAGIKDLKAGEISSPIKTQFGYHIVSVESLTEDEKITPFDEVKDSINSLLQYSKEKETYTNKIKEWKKELKVKVYENRL